MNNKKEIKSVQNVKNLEDHPFLWELLKRHITYKEDKDSNYSKEQLTVLINHYIYQCMHGDILSVLLSEVIIDTPMVDGYRIYNLENLELSNCPMLIGLIKNYISKNEVYAKYSVKSFMCMVSWMFKHEKGADILDIALIEREPIEVHEQQNPIFNDDVKLPEKSKKFISEYLKRVHESTLEGISKEEFDELIYTEYKFLRNEGNLHAIFEFEDFAEAKKIDDEWNEYMKLVKHA